VSGEAGDTREGSDAREAGATGATSATSTTGAISATSTTSATSATSATSTTSTTSDAGTSVTSATSSRNDGGTSASASAHRGVIHDIGYARYAGERQPPSTLWRVIMRHHLSYAWKTLWRFKPWLLTAVATTLVAGAVMYVSQNSLFTGMKMRGGPLRFLDGILPFTFTFYVKSAFLLSMTVGATVVARDRETGAFTFYFSRPVRPIDYVVGRLVGMTILMLLVLAAGPVLLALFRIGLARTSSEAIELIPWIARAAFVGALASVAYAAVPLAISALSGRRTIALGVWAAYYMIASTIVGVIGRLTWKPLGAADLPEAVLSLAFGVWDIDFPGRTGGVSALAAAISLLGQTAIAVVLFYRQIARTAAGAVGGSS
jgi:ABC-2 type transport system permease protein